MRNRIILFAALTAVGLAAGSLVAKYFLPRSDVYLPPGGDFTLQSAEGPVSLASLRGKVVLIYFGYAACPDVCPTSLALIVGALKTLDAPELARVQVLFVSVDPDHDTLAKLREYAAYFHPNIIGTTAPAPVLEEIAARYGAHFRVERLESAAGYAVDHTSFTTVVAPDGKLVEQLPHGTLPAQIVEAVRRALRA
jgi:protein SCO1/2